MVNLSVSILINFIVTSITIIDFLVFCVLFISFISLVPYSATKTSTRIISICVIVFFVVFKCLYFPVFLSTIYLEIDAIRVDIILSILIIINIFISSLTLVCAIITLCRGDPNKLELTNSGDKNVNIIMPIYNENPDSLWKAIESVIKLDYNKLKIVLYLAFDEGVIENELNSDAFVKLMERFSMDPLDNRARINVDINGLLICICRFKHGGKKSAQYGAFKELEKDNSNSLDNSLVFFIDSDIILKSDSLLQFTYHLQKYKKSGLTGLISCIVSKNPSFLSFYQDIEYLTGQIFWRNVESYFSSSTCLPGAFTILKYSFFKKVSDTYFNSILHEGDNYNRYYLGEDRYLTHLLMEVEPYQLSFCQSARCKTDAPSEFSGLMKQRRRWYLGHMANDVWMMSSIELWKNYPFLSLFNLLNNSRNTSVYIYLMYFAIILNKDISIILWVSFIVLPILLNWTFIGIYIFKIKRKMNFLFYIIMIICQPVLNMIYMYYTIWTIRQKGWGGVRVDMKKEIRIEGNSIRLSYDSDKDSFYTCKSHISIDNIEIVIV